VLCQLDNSVKLFKNDDNTDLRALKENEEKRRAKKFFNNPEIIFYLRLWIPCFLIYRIYPPRLLWKARKGDKDAIEKLFRLDKLIIHDPKIKEILNKEQNDDNENKFNSMIKAIQRAPKLRPEIQKVKYSLAGLISISSIALGQKLAAVEIHRLFDAIARDTNKENIIDDDLAVSPETFEKAIQRYRKLWQVIPKADSK
jgi:hypothetical protein